jgi:3-oxoacyl-[acyl-carrier protein] reductase
MDLGLKGRVAVVGASSQGLGRAVARELAIEGASVMLCARGAAALERAREEIGWETGSPVHAMAADLSNPGTSRQVVDAAIERFGKVDILVTNTGGPPSGPFELHDQAAWQAAYDLLLRSPLEMVGAALPGMRERRWGRIITVTSIAVKQPVENLILSNSIRAAVTGFARTLANEVAPFGVTVNNVMPGYTLTERLDELAEHQARARGSAPRDIHAEWEAEIPMARLGRPAEFAAAVAFLASEGASYITAQSIAVDGGWIRSLL